MNSHWSLQVSVEMADKHIHLVVIRQKLPLAKNQEVAVNCNALSAKTEIKMAIFPKTTPDIDNIIIRYANADPRSLAKLSRTSTKAYLRLSNEGHFKQLFAAEHPLLAIAKDVFFQLRTYHPEFCWGIVCCLMQEDYTPFPKEFLERAFPSLTCDLNLQKSAIQARLQETEHKIQSICGSYYQDPNSPIHQAWVVKCAQENSSSSLGSSLQSTAFELLNPFVCTFD